VEYHEGGAEDRPVPGFHLPILRPQALPAAATDRPEPVAWVAAEVMGWIELSSRALHGAPKPPGDPDSNASHGRHRDSATYIARPLLNG
jgi:hypothetical protein